MEYMERLSGFSAGAARVMDALEEAGYQAFLVGGAVRDALCGEIPHDEDIATDADTGQVRTALAPLGGHMIDKGGEKFGMLAILLEGAEYEITTFRCDGKYSDGRHPDEVTFSRDVREDLRRRDFTMNAIAYSPRRGLVDPFGGIGDLRDRLIRAVGAPDERLREDPLRMLRGVRFAVVRGYSLEENTLAAIRRNAPLLAQVSRERVQQEFLKMFSAETLTGTGLLRDSGLLAVISPTLDKLFSPGEGGGQSHTCAVLERCPPDPDLRLAALFLEAAAGEAERFLRDYRFSRARTAYVAALAEERRVLGDIAEAARPREALASFLIKYQAMPDRFFTDMLALMGADLAAGDTAEPSWASRHQGFLWLEAVLGEILDRHLPRRISVLAVDGRDLLAAGLQGRQIAEAQERLLRLVIGDASLNTREELLRRLPPAASGAI